MTSNAEVAVPVWELILTRMGITWFGCYITLRYKEGTRRSLVLRSMRTSDADQVLLHSSRPVPWPETRPRLASPSR
jgi:hypothetical protein